jgi:hypothetical protein
MTAHRQVQCFVCSVSVLVSATEAIYQLLHIANGAIVQEYTLLVYKPI